MGCVGAACLAKLGHKVIGVDVNGNKVRLINEGKPTIIEEGIAELCAEAREKGLMSATIDVREAVHQTDVSFKSGTDDGRPMTMQQGAFAYCYIICDLTDSMRRICTREHLWPTYDNLGYTGYHEQLKIYFEVISYDQLLQSAVERNEVLFDKLGLPHD